MKKKRKAKGRVTHWSIYRDNGKGGWTKTATVAHGECRMLKIPMGKLKKAVWESASPKHAKAFARIEKAIKNGLRVLDSYDWSKTKIVKPLGMKKRKRK